MPRIFPRPVEAALRVLKTICNDATTSIVLRARSAELILSAYGLAEIRTDEEPRHRSTKQVAKARVKVGQLDRTLSEKISADRKQRQLERQIDALVEREQND